MKPSQNTQLSDSNPKEHDSGLPNTPSSLPETECTIVARLESIVGSSDRIQSPRTMLLPEIVTIANTSELPINIVQDNSKEYLQLLDRIEEKAAAQQRWAQYKEAPQTIPETGLAG
ncbi:hypothetical protein C0995_013176 [Termitomyces sp. Mi166|nr:hypothetical protein C0995_013176 [Termitomyces sp. Mi166\